MDPRQPLWRLLSRPTRLGKTASAVDRSWPAHLSASLRSGPGGIWRASSKAPAARLSQASLSGEHRVFFDHRFCRSLAALTGEVLSHSKTLMRVTSFTRLQIAS